MKLVSFLPQEKSYQKEFLELPFFLYKNTPQWVPPLFIDQKTIFNPKKHAFYQNGEACFFLLMDDAGSVIGRMAMMENKKYNAYFDVKAAFFYLFEVINDFSAAKMLIDGAVTWATGRGLTSLIGPKGFTAFDGFGTLIKGFEFQAAFGQIYNPPYYQEFFEQMGFKKVWDTYTGYMDRTFQIPEKVFLAAELIQKKRGFRIRQFNSRQELKTAVDDVKMLYNASLAHEARNIPVTDEEVNTIVNQMLKFANPKFIKLIYKDDNPAGFLLAFPDISNALIKSKGRLFPLGWYHLLREFKTTSSVDLNGMGILPEYQGLGGNALLYAEAYRSLSADHHIKSGEFIQLRDNNAKMLHEWETLGFEMRKIHRLYTKYFG